MKHKALIHQIATTEQTFQEAGGKDIFGKLRMLGLVEIDRIHKRDERNDEHYIDRLITKAKHNYGRVNYIFDIKYNLKENTLTGTAYRKTRWYPFKNFK